MKKVTNIDIAERSGVTKYTVSRVLREENKEKWYNSTTELKVLEAYVDLLLQSLEKAKDRIEQVHAERGTDSYWKKGSKYL